MHDLVIENATVVDGTGAPRRLADVAIDGGRISRIDDVDERGRRTIDAEGRVLAPGFIDVHTHLDAQGFWDPTLSPSPLHGITTAIAGNCGFSVAPLSSHAADYVVRMLSRVEEIPVESLSAGVPWTWESTAEYLEAIDGTLSINTGYMVGHSALRAVVMGPAAVERQATADEIEAMAALLADGLRAGGLGFSSSHSITHVDAENQPVPSRHAASNEFIALAEVCRAHPGTSLEMIVGPPGSFDPEKAELMLAMSRAAQRPLNWNVLFPSADNVDTCLEHLALGTRAAAHGGRIVGLAMLTHSRRPLRFRSLEQVPELSPVLGSSDEELLSLLSGAAGRARFAAVCETIHDYHARVVSWSDYRVLEVMDPRHDHYEGQLVGDIAAREAKDPLDVLCDIVVADRFRTVIELDEPPTSRRDWEALVEVWTADGALVGGSDAGAHLGRLATFNYATTLLEHAVRREELLTLEQAVALLTSKPAELYGLIDRGRIDVGAVADLVLFDETTVAAGPIELVDDLPGGASRTFGGATGVDLVLVAGDEIVRDGTFTDVRPGRVLRSGSDTRTPAMGIAAR